MKEKFDISGMTCAACVANVERAVKKLPGTSDVNVNLMTNSMTLNIDENLVTDEEIVSAVEKIGYGASKKGEKKAKQSSYSDNRERDLKNRLIYSSLFLIALMYVAMGHMIGLPLPKLLEGRSGAANFAFVQFILAISIIFINRSFYISGYKGLYRRAPNMDSLVALGSSAALIYGVFAIFRINYASGINDIRILDMYRHNLYFESAAMILVLITVGKYLEEKSKNKTRLSLKLLLDLAPKKARVVEKDREIVKNVEDIRLGDIILVKPGESVAVDGVVVEGSSFLDESPVTGESIPVLKSKGKEVISASINGNGSFKFKATRVGEDTTISKIISLVDEANQSKAPIAKLADKISGVFVPLVIVISIVTFIAWNLMGYSIEMALNMAISVLVISCPCALGLATPVSIMAATGKSADFGLLFKNAEVLENLHKIDVIVMDKTGTVTEGKPVVTDIDTKIEKNEFLEMAAAIEKNSEHPLSTSIINYAKENKINIKEVEEFKSISGRGIVAKYKDKKYLAGNIELMRENNIELKDYEKKAEKNSKMGKTSMYFADEKEVIGIISVMDRPKKNSKKAIELLYKMGYAIYMLTGDNINTANAIKDELKIEKVYAGLLPDEKNKIIREIQKRGKKVLMIGDGINDAPSLAASDIGMAIGHGTDIAIESSDVILMRSDLLDVVSAMEISKATIKNIKENLFWAFFYNVIGIPLAAGLLYIPFGLKLNPMFGSFAMSLSSVFVVTNALRLRKFVPKSDRIQNREIKKEFKEIKVEGMMCAHCEKRVEEALKNTGKVKSVEASSKNGIVKFENLGLTDEELELVIKKSGYKLEKNNKGEDIMQKTLKIEGMSCNHCVANVKKTLEQINGVTSVDVNLEEGIARVDMDKDIDGGVFEESIKDAGYRVVDVK